MSRTKRSAGSPSALSALAVMGAAVLVTAVPEAYGQDASPPASQSANPSSPAASTQATAATQAAAATQATAGSGATAGASQAGSADKSGKPPKVCFQLTGRCVDPAKTPTTKGGTASASKDGASAKGPLNLTAPDVRTVVSADELKEPLPSDEQITEVQEADTVSVKGEGVPADVPVGFGAIWWALNHPSQAWRIVTPYE